MKSDYFKLETNQATVREEIIGGLTSFFAISYILIVNPLILSDAGMPIALTFFATTFSSVVGCLLMAFWANAPIVLTPGMGVNAFFTYTLVGVMKLSWEQALTVSLISGLLYVLVAFTKLSDRLAAAIPANLKHGITVGIGLFLVELGLEKAEIIRSGGKQSLLSFGSLLNPATAAALLGLLLCIFLVIKAIPGGFLLGIIATTIMAKILRVPVTSSAAISLHDLQDFGQLFAQFDFAALQTPKFWMAVFSMTMILLFESMGLLQGLLFDDTKFKGAFQASSVSSAISSFLGTSPTVAAAESAAGIHSGSRTGLSALVSGIAFIIAAFAAPLLKLIPQAAIAPVIILTGAMMMQDLREIKLASLDDWLPPFLMITLIPFTTSIATGLAFGFVFYPLLKVFAGKGKTLNPILWVISGLFLLNLVLSAFL